MAARTKICTVKNCEAEKYGNKLYCQKHQTRFERHGDPLIVKRNRVSVGDKFGRLTVDKKVGSDKNGNALFFCKCDCGGSTTTRSNTLNQGSSKSCGCLAREIASQKKVRIKITKKLCSKCDKIKNVSEFGKRSTSVDGYKSQCNPCGRLWHKNNPDKVAEVNRHRERKKNHATPSWVDRAAFLELETKKLKLASETGIKYEIDHIIPIKHKLICGLHVPWNLQIVTKDYNNSKGNRVSAKFIQENAIAENVRKNDQSDFLSTDQNLSKFYDFDRNYPLKPEHIHLSYPIVVWWKCKKNHSWPKSVANMQKNYQCPICSGGDPEEFSSGQMAEKLAAEWDHSKNYPWTPENFSRRSGFEAYWICANSHSNSKSIHARGAGVGCPTCMEQGLRYKKTAITEDKRNFEFENKDGSIFNGTIFDFSNENLLDRNRIKEVVVGRSTSHKGWFLKGRDPRKPVIVVLLTHPTFGEFEGPIKEICEKYDLDRNKIYQILSPKYTAVSHKGWQLKNK